MAKGKKKNRNKNIESSTPVAKKDNTTVQKKAQLPNKDSKAKSKEPKTKVAYHDILDKDNLKWIGIGLGVVVLGYLLMIGGKSPDPNVYDEKALFSFVRISLAPILICVGFGLQMYGIMRKTPKSTLADVVEEEVLDAQ